MTKEQIKLVKQTWRLFRGIDPALIGDLFYTKLFADNPSVKKMFPPDMEQQYIKLIDMLTSIVGRLDQLDTLTDEIAAMAQRHVQYGVRPAHYKLAGNALLWTLEKGLGKDWNSEVKEAWQTCYTLLSNTMINASSQSPAT
ncbi:MAG: hemoglobin [Chitinophagaceae bacterium]|nr:hemoglobin [Chitinophagaceae bacterium]